MDQHSSNHRKPKKTNITIPVSTNDTNNEELSNKSIFSFIVMNGKLSLGIYKF